MTERTNRMKVMAIFGTRPEAVKLAPVIRVLRENRAKFSCRVVVTAQHREMLDQVLDLFDIVADDDLDIMTANQTLFDVTANALKGLEGVLQREAPAVVLVQGDTTTCFVGALASFYQGIPVGHVEAGLRTYDQRNPFPEEINRRLTSHIAQLHFAPTERARQNLLGEGIPDQDIIVTGNTVIDALLSLVNDNYRFSQPDLQDIDFEHNKVILLTAHRRESFGPPLRNICLALRDIVQANDDVEIVYPVHMNPNVREVVYEVLAGVNRITLIEPADYETFIQLMNHCYLIMTDSGGVQEEAPSLGKPVLVMRETTERPEAIEAGVAKLVGTDRTRIQQEVTLLLRDPAAYEQMASATNPFGDGRASERIVQALSQRWRLEPHDRQIVAEHGT